MGNLQTKTPNRRGPWLKDPKKAREGETIGGGYFVFRRGGDTNRIRPAQWPFEYSTYNEAKTEAEKLSMNHPGYVFDVVGTVFHAFCEPMPNTQQSGEPS